MSEQKLETQHLRTELLAFINEFSAFNDHCSFLCDAMSALCWEYKESEPDINTIMGASRHFSWLKQQAEKLKNELDRIHRQP